MLARLLRALYLFQLLAGALLGSFLAQYFAGRGAGAAALLWVPAGALLLPLLGQWVATTFLLLQSGTTLASRLGWRVLWGEFRAAVLIFMLRMPWPHQPNEVLPALAAPADAPGATAKPTALPVLLVHGYVCNHRVWDDMALALRQAGHPVLAISLEPLFASIDGYAAQLERAASTLLAQTDARQLAVVGHSMGGLVIRAWLRTLDNVQLQRVARIVTLGSPHQGTRIAAVSLTPNGAQMAWHSPWLQALERSEDSPRRALMRCAISAHDNVVYPQREQVLPGVPVTEFQGLGHLQMCLDRGVIDWVRQQLAATPAQGAQP